MNKENMKKNLPKAIGAIIVIALVVTVGIIIVNKDKVKHPNQSGYVITSESVYFFATGAAKAIVNDELLYPLNSEFEDESDFSVYYDKEEGQYTVKGIVYASNGFSVKQKKYFTVKLTLSNLDKSNYSYRKISCDIN